MHLHSSKLTAFRLVLVLASFCFVLTQQQAQEFTMQTSVSSPQSVSQTTPQSTQQIQSQTTEQVAIDSLQPTTGDQQLLNQKLVHDFNKALIDYDGNFLNSSVNFFNNDAESIRHLNTHHNNEELYDYLNNLQQRYPSVTRLYSIGESVEKRKLWALEITENPGQHIALKPEFRYIANMHGNEVVGREALLSLARLLLENYHALSSEPPNDSRPTGPKFVKKLLEATRIHLLPSLNPDGYVRSVVGCKYEEPSRKGRLNANNVDLNRNFPDPIMKTHQDPATQPEVLAFIEWSHSEPFVLSANLHGGAIVTNYPYDGSPSSDIDTKRPNLAPDNDVFQDLALTYSKNHPTMHKGEACYDQCTEYHTELFPKGITNGASWYPVYGGLQDWIYTNTNELDLTIEMGCNQYPPAEMLSHYWAYNKQSLLALMCQVHKGIKGIVQDERTGLPIAGVAVHVLNSPLSGHNVSTSKYGDYFRILTKGNYNILFEKHGYESKEMFVSILDTMAQIYNIKLAPTNASRNPISTNDNKQPEDSSGRQKPSDSDGNETDNDDHSIIVATLVMSVLTVMILLLMGAAFVIQRRRLTRSQSMSVELQPRSASTGISLPQHRQQQPGSSINTHSAA